MSTVYLLHFSERYEHAQHYIGFTTNLEQRIEAHQSGNGARLVEVVKGVGIDVELARTWEVDSDDSGWFALGKTLERKLKSRKNAKMLCPICSGQQAYNRARS